MAYAVANNAASLAGLDVGQVTAAHVALADQLVDAMMNRVPDGFTTKTATAESHDINILGTRGILLKHHPVISVTSVVIGPKTGSPVTLASSNYFEENGILKLITPANVNTATDWVSSFPKGVGVVAVTYNYGFASTPTLIVQLSNVIAGKIGKMAVQDASRPSSGASVIRIGDFEERFESGNRSAILDLFDESEKILMKQAEAIYREYRF
jgi:hypothetical protein